MELGGGDMWSDYLLFWLAISDQRNSGGCVTLISRQWNTNTHTHTHVGALLWAVGEQG